MNNTVIYIKHLPIHVESIIYPNINLGVYIFSVHIGFILPNCLLVWPSPLKYGETLWKKLPLPRGDLGLSSLSLEGKVLLEGPDSLLLLVPGFWSSVWSSVWPSGPGELGMYSGLLGT